MLKWNGITVIFIISSITIIIVIKSLCVTLYRPAYSNLMITVLAWYLQL